MRLNQITTSTLLLTAAILALAAPMGANAAPPASNAGTARVISTAGLQRFNAGGGATVYTNTPGAISYFGWNTGSSAGAVNGVSTPSAATIGK